MVILAWGHAFVGYGALKLACSFRRGAFGDGVSSGHVEAWEWCSDRSRTKVVFFFFFLQVFGGSWSFVLMLKFLIGIS